MRRFKSSVLVIALAASFMGCAADESDPVEGSTSSEVTEQAANFVLACGGLALRSFDHPDATVKEILPYGFIVHVGQVDWLTRVANIPSTPAHPENGWVRDEGCHRPTP